MGVLPLLPHLVFDYRTFTLRLRVWHMGAPDSGLSKLTVPEGNLLLLLDTAGSKSYGYDGSVKWALNVEDVLPARTRRASLAKWEPRFRSTPGTGPPRCSD
jgi:hypothetical protein